MGSEYRRADQNLEAENGCRERVKARNCFKAPELDA
jgi:hypothetical protein